jgi:subtilisin family serine protease
MRTPLALLVALLLSLAAAAPAAGAADPLRPHQWGLDMIEADAAHATATGTGAVVAVIDTGVLATHEDLVGQLVPGFDIVSNDSDPQDDNGHGTHVTGIVAAHANNGVGIEGVAPGARVMPIRVLNKKGEGTSEGVAKGIDYAVDHHADVINLSLGTDAIGFVLGGDDPTAPAIERALKAGIVVVAAAGNDSLPVCEQPSTQGKLLCVGSVDKRGMRSVFSSTGDLMAPGGSSAPAEDEDILSTYNDGKYMEIAGTSQATPHVAGVAALLVSLGVRGQAAVDRILATATDAGPSGPDDMYGAGIVNARAAVAGLKGGAGGGPSGGGGGAKASISYRRVQSIRRVLRSGVRVRCRAAAAGRCHVRVNAHGKKIAAGSANVASGARVQVRARLTPTGRRMLRHAVRVRARLLVDVPGAPRRFKRALTLVR